MIHTCKHVQPCRRIVRNATLLLGDSNLSSHCLVFLKIRIPIRILHWPTRTMRYGQGWGWYSLHSCRIRWWNTAIIGQSSAVEKWTPLLTHARTQNCKPTTFAKDEFRCFSRARWHHTQLFIAVTLVLQNNARTGSNRSACSLFDSSSVLGCVSAGAFTLRKKKNPFSC